MPDIYISRAGMETKDLDTKFTQTELSSLKDQLVQVELAEKLKDERIKQLEQTIHTLQHDFQEVAALLRLKPRVRQVEAALERKRTDQ